MYKLRQKKLKNKNSRECDANQENEFPDDPKEKSVNQTKVSNYFTDAYYYKIENNTIKLFVFF